MNAVVRTLLGWLVSPQHPCGALTVLGATSLSAFAQDKPAGYPVRPVRIIIGVAPGAGADMVALKF